MDLLLSFATTTGWFGIFEGEVHRIGVHEAERSVRPSPAAWPDGGGTGQRLMRTPSKRELFCGTPNIVDGAKNTRLTPGHDGISRSVSKPSMFHLNTDLLIVSSTAQVAEGYRTSILANPLPRGFSTDTVSLAFPLPIQQPLVFGHFSNTSALIWHIA